MIIIILILSFSVIYSASAAVEATCSDRAELVAALNRTEEEIIITLNGNISPQEYEDELVIPAGKTVTINLNNYTLSTGTNHVGESIPLIRIREGAALYLNGPGSLSELDIGTTTAGLICNSGTVTIDGVSLLNKIGSRSTNTGLMILEDFTVSGAGFSNSGENAELIMNGGEISGLDDYWAIANYEGASFIMNGGSITGNNCSAIYNRSGSATMNGGIISGNNGIKESASHAGGVECFNDASFTMNGGTISNNIGRYSGGVSMSGGIFTMTGGSIVGNIATDQIIAGGVVCYSGYRICGDVLITGNKRRDSDGNEIESNIYVGSSNPIELTGPLASGSRIGYGLVNYSESTVAPVTLGLSAKDDSGNPYGTEANFIWDHETEGINVFNVMGELYLAGETVVTLDAADGSGRTAQVTAPRKIDWSLPECPFAAPDIPGTEFLGWAKYNTEDIVEPGGTMFFENAATTLQAKWQSYWGAVRKSIMDSELEEISIVLDNDMIAGSWDRQIDIANGKKVTIDLNGHRMDTSHITQWWGYCFDIKEGGELTLTDTAGGGLLTGQSFNFTSSAAITNAGTFRMKGGTISSNIGYGVYNTGTFIMTGGAISYNQRGGVTGTGTIEVSGSVQIINNGNSSPAYNVLLSGDQKIRIRQEDGGLAEDALIGIHEFGSPFTVTAGATGADGTVYARPKNFRPDSSLLVGKENGEIILSAGVNVLFDANGGSGRQGDVLAAPGGELTLPACSFTPPRWKVFDAWEVEGNRYAPGETAEAGQTPAAKALWKDEEFTFAGTNLTGLTDSYGSVISVSLPNSISPYYKSAFQSGDLVVRWYRINNGEREEIQGEMDYQYMNASIPGTAVAGEYEFVMVIPSENREALVKPFSVWHMRQYDLIAPGFTLNKTYDGQPILLTDNEIRVNNGAESWEALVAAGLSRPAWVEEYSNRIRVNLDGAPEEPGTYYLTMEEKTADGTWVSGPGSWKVVISQADSSHPRYAVTFDLAGGEGTTPETVVLTTGESITLPDCTATKPECQFMGWSCLINGNTSIYSAGSTITPNAKVKATANWAFFPVTLQYGIYHRTGNYSASEVEGTYWQGRNPDKKYIMNYGSSGYVPGSGITLFDLTACPADGFFFEGWYEGKSDTEYYIPSSRLITREAHHVFTVGSVSEGETLNIVAVFAKKGETGEADVILPDNLLIIEAEAFTGTGVKSVVIPKPAEGKTVTLAAGAFRNCTNLQWIEIPEGVTVKPGAFDGCSNVICYGGGGAAVAEEYAAQGFIYGGE